MEKKFKMMEDHLQITVIDDEIINLPTKDGMVEIGSFDRTMIQKISLDKIKFLMDFIEGENEKAEVQLKGIDQQLESIGEIIELDDKIVEACRKQIGKGTKVFKQKMLVLSNHLEEITRRKALITQKEYIEKQHIQMNGELTDIKEATKKLDLK